MQLLLAWNSMAFAQDTVAAPLLTTNGILQGSTPQQPPASTHCVDSQRPIQDQFTSHRAHRHGLFHRLANKTTVVGKRRVHIVGGLVPAPNIAAQAGSLDPTVAAMAFSSRDPRRKSFFGRRGPVIQPLRVGLSCPSP
jgi:hypothetical protein